MIELDDLRSLIEVVESGGFGRAAMRLGISKSMVSRRIARMEAELGARLVSRTTRGISATDAGLELKARGERILAALEEAREAVAEDGAEAVGRLRLSAPSTFARQLAPALGELAKRHPRLELDVSFTNRRVDLVAERYDAAIRIGVLQDSSLVARRIAAVRGVVAASPDYLARHGRPRAPGDLLQHECLIYPQVPEWVFQAGARKVSIRPRGRLYADDAASTLQWAIEGLGVCALPSFVVSDAIESGRIEPILLDYPMPEAAIHVLRPPGPHVPGKVRVLIDAMVERFGGEPVWDRCLMRARQRG
jgi:DNA-binding transcriptional LysR family regulator